MSVTLKRKLNFKILIFVLSSLASIPSSAALCKQWSAPTEVGKLPTQAIDEQSGAAASATEAHLFHNNDSGDFSKIYVTDLTGKLVAAVSYSDQLPLDVEDLSYGKCDSGKTKNCIFVGDIGDNLGLRPAVAFHLIEERKTWPAKVTALRTLYARFPDGTHDAESFAVHPNGDIILITKSYGPGKKVGLKANIYRLEAKKVLAGGAQFFTKIGVLDLPKIAGTDKYKESVATSMSIAPDGKSFLVLTYKNVIEFDFDFSRGNIPELLKAGSDYQIVKIKELPQMEGITHSSDGKSFFYSSEGTKKEGVPLMQVRCLAN